MLFFKQPSKKKKKPERAIQREVALHRASRLSTVPFENYTTFSSQRGEKEESSIAPFPPRRRRDDYDLLTRLKTHVLHLLCVALKY